MRGEHVGCNYLAAIRDGVWFCNKCGHATTEPTMTEPLDVIAEAFTFSVDDYVMDRDARLRIAALILAALTNAGYTVAKLEQVGWLVSSPTSSWVHQNNAPEGESE